MEKENHYLMALITISVSVLILTVIKHLGVLDALGF